MNIKQSDIKRASEALTTYYANKKLTRIQYAHLQNMVDVIKTAQQELEMVLDCLQVPCPGGAHDPAIGGMQDNCAVCMPDWGVIQNPSMVAK
jgi:hypothetical protein